MSRYIFVLLLMIGASSFDGMVRRVDVQQGYDEDGNNQGYYYQEEDIWYGPGWYNGVWFGTEIEFNDWHYHHHHDYPHQHYHNYSHQDGGGHHGGGHR